VAASQSVNQAVAAQAPRNERLDRRNAIAIAVLGVPLWALALHGLSFP
jgi:hypothetical protein